MAKAKALNLKNMKETLVNYSQDQKELEKIWDGFYTMTTLGFISRDTWKKFFDECKGWYIWEDDKRVCVRDSETGDGIIWEYNPDTEYRA